MATRQDRGLGAMTEQKPIVVNASAVPAAAGTVVRDILVMLAALPILTKLIGARDLTAILQWLQSSDGAAFLAVVVPIAVSAWRAWRSVKEQREKVALASAAPDSVAVVANPGAA